VATARFGPLPHGNARLAYTPRRRQDHDDRPSAHGVADDRRFVCHVLMADHSRPAEEAPTPK
jgi:hypothetical protein